jgi:hypothetical protein
VKSDALRCAFDVLFRPGLSRVESVHPVRVALQATVDLHTWPSRLVESPAACCIMKAARVRGPAVGITTQQPDGGDANAASIAVAACKDAVCARLVVDHMDAFVDM